MTHDPVSEDQRPDAASTMRQTGPVDRQAIRDEMRQRRDTLYALLRSLSVDELKRPSYGTRWNHEELLFHMVFGYIVVVVLTSILTLLGRLPRPATRPFAALLNAFTRPFNAMNYLASRLGAKVFNHRRMGATFERVCASLCGKLDRASEASLQRGMYYPTRWDPFFKEYMTLADLFRYPTRHFDFHLQQLARPTSPAAQTASTPT